MYSIHMLAADHGDCLWIEYGNTDAPKRILIDAGTPGTYKKSLLPKIKKVVEEEGGCKFELFVITHIDADHIGGAFEFLKNTNMNKVSINDIWFNGYYHLSNNSPDFLGVISISVVSCDCKYFFTPKSLNKTSSRHRHFI